MTEVRKEGKRYTNNVKRGISLNKYSEETNFRRSLRNRSEGTKNCCPYKDVELGVTTGDGCGSGVGLEGM